MVSYLLFGCGHKKKIVTPPTEELVTIPVVESLPDPGKTGDFKVMRWEYGKASQKFFYDITPYYKSFDKRVSYKPNRIPLHGTVFYPSGKGHYPLIIVAHGNFSDPLTSSDSGYDYLLKNLASHGFIAASLDMNFLNGEVYGENQARAMVILQHLKLFRKWNFVSGTPLRSKIDINNIGMIGHSRGGEAVAGAAFLNIKLHNPKKFEMDFGFKIKSIFTMAPTDGQFPVKGGSAALIPNDVEYFMLQGSRDTGTYNFRGIQFFSKLFSSSRQFRGTKSMLWIYGANHSNWNTVWEKAFSRKISPEALSPKHQRQIALTYSGAYFLMTLYGKDEYRDFFRGDKKFESMPEDVKTLSQYQPKKVLVINDFEKSNKGVKTYNPLGLLEPYEVRSFEYFANSDFYHLCEDTNGLIVGWSGTTAAKYVTKFSKSVDVKNFPVFSFKVGQVYDQYASKVYDKQDFSVVMETENGKSKPIKVSDYGEIFYPDIFMRGEKNLTKSMLRTVRIPFKDFFDSKKIPPIKKIIFEFNIKKYGLLAFDDIGFTE